MTKPRDTSADTWQRQLRSFRTMTPQRRLQVAAVLSDEVRRVAHAGIQARHPEYSIDQVRDALEDMILGSDVAATVGRARASRAR